MTLTITWWMVPTAITIISVLLALNCDRGGGQWAGLSVMFALVPASLVSMVSWIIAAFFK